MAGLHCSVRHRRQIMKPRLVERLYAGGVRAGVTPLEPGALCAYDPIGGSSHINAGARCDGGGSIRVPITRSVLRRGCSISTAELLRSVVRAHVEVCPKA